MREKLTRQPLGTSRRAIMMMRKVKVAFFISLCFILLFAAQWYIPSRNFAPFLRRTTRSSWKPLASLRESEKKLVGLDAFLATVRKKRRHKMVQQRKISERKPRFLMHGTLGIQAGEGSPGRDVPRGTDMPRAASPRRKNSRDVSDRLMWHAKNKKRKSKVQGVLLLFWSTWFGKRLNLDESWAEGQCPTRCTVTSDLSRAEHASAFIVHARDSYPLPPRDDVPWILFTQENPVYTIELSDMDYMSKFQLLKSYRLDSDFPDPTFTAPNFDAPTPFENKTGFIIAVFSNCEPVRTEYMRQLMEFVKVDSYGACNQNKHGLVPRYGSGDFRKQKVELARRYKFSLVFFNQDCDYFVDDQLTHALDAGAVPVVMGTDKIGEFMPGRLRDAYVNVRNFTSPRRLAEYLIFLGNNETEYNKYLEWKFKGFGDIDETVIGKHFHPAYPPYCQVCVAVAERKVHEEGLRPDLCTDRQFKDWNLTIPGWELDLDLGSSTSEKYSDTTENGDELNT